MTSSLLDTALDLSVIGGYTNVGYRIRSRGWKPLPRMEGKLVLITGATSGLGLAAAGGFARPGARVWLAVRNRDRGEAVRARILEHQGDADVYVESCDLSRCEAGRGFAERFTGEAQRLDVLVNNAGVLTQGRELSADGIEA
jgi:NAD(P)-dependent dehydrogenase (short-subunit alcohol dehydrogenase family)